jgi:hypothetical protein
VADHERFLGRVIDFDPKTDVIILKADFLAPDKQQIIEDLYKSKDEFSFLFKKPFRRLKTYAQLKKYFRLLKEILIKSKIEPEAQYVKTLDIEMKKSCLVCKRITIGDKEIFIVPSKADLTVEQMSDLIKQVMERYNVE